ncbi:hypothetical protein ABE522_06815 [Stenotrophomonas pennii]|uniref:hypothetical protein n=1 Tax=Stenotrophomonas lacuserhaii TaxID=2760084 RepID=UPI0032082FFF
MGIFKPFMAITLIIAISGCVEVASNEYANRDQAQAMQAIGDSKWLPLWLPEDAVDIRETHDMDTNESWLVFVPSSGAFVLPEECRKTTELEIPDSSVMQRFPRFARAARSRASGNAGTSYLCLEGNTNRWVMHDKELNLVYSRVKF